MYGDSLLQRKLGGSSIVCDENIQEIETYQQSLHTIMETLSSFPINSYIDLTIKQKSLYLLMEHTDDSIQIDPNEIPDKIQQIFLNFIIVYNLCKKQIIFKKNHISLILSQIKEKTGKIKDLNHNLQAVSRISTLA